jgi:NitT/TauT family transport system substrate-binding protein
LKIKQGEFFMRGLLRTTALMLVALLATAGGASAQGKPITLAATLTPDVPQVILAIEKGYWKELGIEVKIVPFATGREAFEALLGGQVDFAALAEFPMTIGILRQQKFAVVADLARYNAQRVIASAKKMPLKSLAELEGKKIGTTLGSNAEFLAGVILNEGGVKAQIVNVAPADIVPALSRGDIDAAVMFPSFYAQAKKALGDDYREIITTKYTSHFVIAGTPDMVGPRSAEATAFMKGLMRADVLVKTEPAATQEAILRAMKGVMSAEVLAGIFKDTDYKVILNEELVSLVQREAVWIVERGLVKASASVTDKTNIRSFIRPEILSAVAKDNVALSP